MKTFKEYLVEAVANKEDLYKEFKASKADGDIGKEHVEKFTKENELENIIGLIHSNVTDGELNTSLIEFFGRDLAKNYFTSNREMLLSKLTKLKQKLKREGK